MSLFSSLYDSAHKKCKWCLNTYFYKQNKQEDYTYLGSKASKIGDSDTVIT